MCVGGSTSATALSFTRGQIPLPNKRPKPPHLHPLYLPHSLSQISLLVFSSNETSDARRGSSMLILTYVINALDDHLPSRSIASGLCPIAASLIVSPILPECSANSSRISCELATFPSLSHVSATTGSSWRKHCIAWPLVHTCHFL